MLVFHTNRRLQRLRPFLLHFLWLTIQKLNIFLKISTYSENNCILRICFIFLLVVFSFFLSNHKKIKINKSPWGGGKYSGIKYLTYLSLVHKGSLYKDLHVFGLWLSGSPLPRPLLYLTQSGLIHWNVSWSPWSPSRGYCEWVQSCHHSSCSQGRKERCSTEAWIGPCCWGVRTGGRTGTETRWCPAPRFEPSRGTPAAPHRCPYTCLKT